MTHRNLLCALLLGLVSSVVFGAGDRPNIVLIVVDDLGFSDLGCYGGEIHTPRLDQLAEEGIRFSRYHVAPMCVVSRVALFSGREHRAAGSNGFPNGVSMAHLLRDAGYATSMAGKTHGFSNFRIGDPSTDYGFDRFWGFDGGEINSWTGTGNVTWYDDERQFHHSELPSDFYATDAITDKAIEFIEQAVGQDKPFFCYVAYNAPHTPIHAYEADVRKYFDTGVYERGWDVLSQERFDRQIAMGLIPPETVLPEYGVEIPKWELLPQTSPHHWVLQKEFEAFRMSSYAGMVDRVDQKIGELIDFLQNPSGDPDAQDSLLDETIILFMSDNGACYAGMFTHPSRVPWDPSPGAFTGNFGLGMLSNTPFRHYKHAGHEGALRAPLIVRWPEGISTAPGTIVHGPARIWDIYPTLLELAGTSYPASYQGRAVKPLMGQSITPFFDNPDAPGNPDFVGLYSRGRGWVEGDWKLVNYATSAWELYHLKTDPTESDNLAGVRPDILQRLLDHWDQYTVEHGFSGTAWDPEVADEDYGWGYDRIRAGLVSAYPEYMSAGVPLDAKLSLTFAGTLDFNGTAGRVIRLQKYGDPSILWSADLDAAHPAQGQMTITFEDWPQLEPNSHYYITWDTGWAKYGGTSILAVQEAAYAYRFKTAAVFAGTDPNQDSNGNGFSDLIDYAFCLSADDTEAVRQVQDTSTKPPTDIVRFTTPCNPIDVTILVEYSPDGSADYLEVVRLMGETVIENPMIVQTVHTFRSDDQMHYTLRLKDPVPAGAVFRPQVLLGFVPPPGPTAPADLTAVAADGIVRLDWADSITPDIVGYNIYRSTTPSGPYAEIRSLTPVSHSYDVTVTNGTAYYYVVTAQGADNNESYYSDEVSATPLDQAGGYVAAHFEFNTHGDTEGWTGIHGTTPVQKISINGVEGVLTSEEPVVGNDPKLVYNPDLTLQSPFFSWGEIEFRVRQLDDTGQASMEWDPRGTILLLQPGGVNFDWIEPENDYTITPEPEGDWIVVRADIYAMGAGSINSIRLDPIGHADNEGKNYEVDYVRVIGLCAPLPPTGMAAVRAGGTSVHLDWQDSPDAALSTYRVHRGTSAGGPYTLIASDLTDSHYTDTGAGYNEMTYYAVTAVGTSGGVSGYSNETAIILYLGDLTLDGRVNIEDLEELASQWLSVYDMTNFTAIAKDWLLNHD